MVFLPVYKLGLDLADSFFKRVNQFNPPNQNGTYSEWTKYAILRDQHGFEKVWSPPHDAPK